MEPLMIAAIFTGAVLLAGFAAMSRVLEKAEVRDSLRRLEGYQLQDTPDQEMLAPISERVVAPLIESLAALTQRFTPQGYREQVARRLVLAGSPANLDVDQILVAKLFGAFSGLLWFPLLFLVLGL